MTTVKEGDRVRVIAREPSSEDVKSGMYYGHFAGMTGTVQKVYSKAEVAVEVEHDSLAKELRKRHDDVRDQMKTKWMDGLSEEGRSRLTEREKDFNLRYMVLVSMDNLENAGKRPDGAAARPLSVPPTPPAAVAAAPDDGGDESSDGDAATPHRLTLEEIEAAEQEELLRRAQQGPEA